MLVFLIQGCGFKLRGSVDLSSDISPVYLQQNSIFELGREIESLLMSNKIDLTESKEQSRVQLVLLNETKRRRVLSVDSRGRAREYSLAYTVNYSLNIKSSKMVDTAGSTTTEVVDISRSLLFDPDTVLAVANESEILYRDMRRDAARLILLKLQARSKKGGR